MKFHTFICLNPNGYGGGYDDRGNPVDAPDNIKVCFNLVDVVNVQQIGHYQNIEVPQDPAIEQIDFTGGDIFNTGPTPANRPAARRGTTARPRQQQRVPTQWVIDNTRFLIQIRKGNMWTVIGSFDEFTAILSQFQNDRETVE